MHNFGAGVAPARAETNSLPLWDQKRLYTCGGTRNRIEARHVR